MSIQHLIRPTTIAIIGASREETKIGHMVLKNILDGGYPRDSVFPVNPKVDSVLGLKCYPSVKDIPVEIDLAVIVVPAKVVPKVMEDCAEKRVKTVAIISSGFKEVGNVEGERKIVEIARRAGIRLLGPNIVGIADTPMRINASFMPYLPVKGHIAFISQSGALAIGLVTWTKLKEIGLSDVVSIGNKADVSEIDLIDFFSKDPCTRAVTLYLEGVEDGRRFMEVARRATKLKPIVILKAGRGKRTAEAIKSHTGSLAGSDKAYDAAFRQCGILRAETFPTLFDYGLALASLPDPEGENVVILTNGGGAGIMATDACEEYGLKLMDIPKDLAYKLREYMPEFGSTLNPVDLTGMATDKEYYGSLRMLDMDKRVHAIIILYCHTAISDPMKLAEAIVRRKQEGATTKPIVAALIGGRECDEAARYMTKHGIPTFENPERAVAALASKYRYWRYRRKPVGRPVEVKGDRDRAREMIGRAVKEGRALTPSEASEVAYLYGIPVVRKKIASSKEEALKLAEEIGYPITLEAESPDIIHKVDVGAIKLNLKGAEDVKRAYDEILKGIREKAPNARIRGIVVRPFVKQGLEVAIGMHRDELFGPMIMFGSGGTLVELYKDVSFRIAPLTDIDIEELLEETKVAKVLKGFRTEPKDVEAVKEVIASVNQLALDFPEITDIDINPLFVYEKGCMAFDIKVLLRKPEETTKG
jgi:acetyltransferase